MNETTWLALSVALTVFAVAGAVNDICTRRVSNALVLAGLFAALLLRAGSGGVPLVYGVAGATIALTLGFPLFALGAFGGGDIKFMMACGAFLGLPLIGRAALFSAAAGGVLALLVIGKRRVSLVAMQRTSDLWRSLLTFGRQGERMTVQEQGAIVAPYAVAIAVGTLLAWFGAAQGWMP